MMRAARFLILGFLLFSAAPIAAQVASGRGAVADRPIRYDLAGPRLGLTVFTGDVAARRRSASQSAAMSQLGWQWERRVYADSIPDTGPQLLVEQVMLLGGAEQEEFNLSYAVLFGFRGSRGRELGIGANVTLNDAPTSSLVLAAGVTSKVGRIDVPVNLAMAIAKGGPRFTLLTGWIVR